MYGDEVAEWNQEVFQLLKSRLDKPYSCFDGVLNPEYPHHWLKKFLDETEPAGWRFYLGNSGETIRNAWYLDSDGKWYWFDGAGIMISNKWYKYNGDWYYLDKDGRMTTEPVMLTPDHNGALQYPGLTK
ncbi:hypothetical protein [Lacrimispora sp.]|uniref:hypothetical protein n=1 Tax=Lacrimispora sp. TaxID=2719234 RepID=UPI002F41DA35